MSTKADFYVGRGPHAEWVGSLRWDGDPDGVHEQVLSATTEAEFRGSLRRFLHARGEDATLPEQGWPWLWPTSATTDYAYAFDDGQVFVSVAGRAWIPISAWPTVRPYLDARDRVSRAEFPDMTARR